MGSRGDKEFSHETMRAAFKRQNKYCASCGIRLWDLGREGEKWHRFGEYAEAHHVRPVKAGGTAEAANCVIVCRSCHISAHKGGAFADASMYEKAGSTKQKPLYVSTATIAKGYPFYRYSANKQPELDDINKRYGK